MEKTYVTKEICDLKYNALEERVVKVEEHTTKRDDAMNVVEKAIVAIQAANDVTSQTLAKLEQKLNGTKDDAWFKLFEKIILILLGFVAAILGAKL